MKPFPATPLLRRRGAHRARLSLRRVIRAPRRFGMSVALVCTATALLGLACTSTARAAVPTPVGQWPLDPRPPVVRGFEPPPRPWMPGHRGIDLLGRPGQAVRAALPGSITYAATLAGRGVVVISHGATRTTYEPVVPAVRVGDSVAAGQAIGRLSAVGSHCPPRACLHWGLIRGSEYLDPLSLVGAVPVRLLPLTEPASPGRTVRGGRTRGGIQAEPTPPSDVPPSRFDSVAQEEERRDGLSGLAVGLAAAASVAGGVLISRH